MSLTTAVSAPHQRPLAGRLPRRVAFALNASIVVSFLAASSAPTPLYARYAAQWDFSSITTTVVFGVYAIAVLGALLVVGSLSDHVGRRPVLGVALVLQAAAMVTFVTADGVAALLVARVAQGLATGAAVGAVGAGLLDLSPRMGTITNAAAPVTGTATGALGSGLIVQTLPSPTHLVYLVLLGVFALQAVGVALMPETSGRLRGAWASLRPRIAVPAATRRAMAVAVPVLIAVWSLAGFYGSVAPAVVRDLVGSDSVILGGLGLFELAGAAAMTVVLLRAGAPRTMMRVGTAALVVGVGATVLGATVSSAAAFFAGTAIAGVGFGAGFQGAIRMLLPLAAPHERSGLLAAIYVVSYLAMGVPAIIGGVLVVHGAGLLPTTRDYGLAVMALAAAALVAVARPAPRCSSRPECVAV